ncbi:MAG: DUF4167 domain-containing protein [Alphaproteobacteria bacterium]|nr:DUF4167 domain-containing protein [Alphaproteobacteria bacterium]
MRQGPNGRRPRNRHHNGNGNGNGNGGGGGNSGGNRPRSAASLRHQSFDSNCGDMRVRGNAWQVCEKYQALARDATSSGDRVAAENYLQHAEHYFRIIEAINEATAAEQRQRGVPFDGQQPPMPNNYYGADGSQPQPGGEPNGNAQPQPAQAEVTAARAPQPAAFFTQEEIDEHNRSENRPLAAAR